MRDNAMKQKVLIYICSRILLWEKGGTSYFWDFYDHSHLNLSVKKGLPRASRIADSGKDPRNVV